MLKIGVPNYCKKVLGLCSILWGVTKPMANAGVPECTGAIGKNIQKKEKREGTVS